MKDIIYNKPFTLTCTVTDIKRGKPCNPHSCPLVKSFRRAFGRRKLKVDFRKVETFSNFPAYDISIKLTDWLAKWVIGYDKKETAKPFNKKFMITPQNKLVTVR